MGHLFTSLRLIRCGGKALTDVAGKRRPARVIRHTAGHDLCRASRPHRPCIPAPPSLLDANDRDGHEVELRDARPRAAHRRREVRGSPAVRARRRPERPPAPGALRRGGRPGRPVRGAGQDPKDAHLTNRRERGHRRDRSHRPPGQRRGHGHRGRDCDLRHHLRGARRHRRRGLRPADRQLPGAVQRGRPDRGRLPQARRRRARERDPHRQTRGPTAPSHDPKGLGLRHADPRVGALVRRRTKHGRARHHRRPPPRPSRTSRSRNPSPACAWACYRERRSPSSTRRASRWSDRGWTSSSPAPRTR